ncbi:MAG: hypothetical protein HWD84_11020 [Flavobacteriaceae bacterium]|nr:hypothetical protein [Flavobacteriaceae bacterium]
MSYDNSEDLINRFISKFGEDELNKLLLSRLTEDSVLTIIGNEGVHSVPPQYLHGEIFVASRGNLDFSDETSIKCEYKKVLEELFAKLNERSWKQVYFVPTGHTTLALQIKQLVYHVLRQSTVDLFYSKGTYIELDMDYRELVSKATHNKQSQSDA